MKQIFLDIHQVAETTSLSEAKIYDMCKKNEFPKPRRIAQKRVGWLFREVELWAEERPISDLLPPGRSLAQDLQDSQRVS
ncbi:helix-turn-helix transcriptional regulator [Burkholderia glumae]|uniref:helix-turn-helix transcriptional regulator n=1 Tax=Burkholderia glumae TaxID=337 RepID=UPI003B9C88A5